MESVVKVTETRRIATNSFLVPDRVARLGSGAAGWGNPHDTHLLFSTRFAKRRRRPREPSCVPVSVT